MPFWAVLGALFVEVGVSAALAYGSAWLAGQLARKPRRGGRTYGNMPLQRAEKGGAVSKVYGTEQVAGNVIGVWDEGYTEIIEGYYVPVKSFLIHVCEGPATVQRIWLEKTMREVGPKLGAGIYLFDGDGNVSSGWHPSSHPVKQAGWSIRELTGEEFGDYVNSCCVFFYRRACDISGAVPQFMFEVSSLASFHWANTFIAANDGLNILDAEYNFIEINNFGGASGCMAVALNLDGEVVAGHSGGIRRRTAAGDYDDSYYVPDGGWPGGMNVVRGLQYSHDGLSLYTITGDGELYKFLVSSGDEVWVVNTGIGVYSLAIDSSENIYVQSATGVQQYDSSGASGTAYGGPNLMNDIWADEGLGKLFAVGMEWLGGPSPSVWQMAAYTLSDGTFLWQKEFDYDSLKRMWAVVVKGGAVYCAGDRMDLGGGNYASVFKLNPSTGATIASYDTGYNATHIWINQLNQLVVKGSSTEDKIYVFSTLLTLISSYDYTESGVYGSQGVNVPNDIAKGLVADMNPADIIEDLVEHVRYGAGSVGITLNATKLAAARAKWAALGMLLSLHLNEQRPLTDWIDYVLSQCDGFQYESGGQLCLGVFKDEDPVFEITADDWLRADGENPPPPVNIAERPPSDTYNEIIVACTDRDNNYVEAFPVAKDKLDQRLTGVRKRTIDMKGIHDPQLGQRMAWRALIKSLYTFHIFTGPVTYKFMLIENGDVGLISDGGKIVRRKVRVLKIEEDINGRGLELTMMEDEARHHPTIGFLPQPNLSTPAATVTLADGTIAFREDVNSAKLYLSIAPGGAFTNGFKIYRSYDDSTFDLAGRAAIDGVTGGDGNSTGTIQGTLAAHGSMTWAKDESVLVSIGTVTDLHTDITEDEFWSDRRLARIGNEIIAFKTAVETATPGIWTISNLRRGCFGTEPVAHSSGETFETLDTNLTYDFDQADIGRTLYFKALAFYGNDEEQDIADVSSFSVTIGGYYQRPAAASLLRLTAAENDGGSGEYSSPSFTLYWNLGSRVSGWNFGGWDVSGGGPAWNNYTADGDLQDVLLKFEQSDGTPIGQRSIAVASQATITKATDLGGFATARIRVVPRRVLGSRLENWLLVTSV